MAERIFSIFDGPDKGATFVMGDQPVALGREGGCDVVLHDDRASRVHARIMPEGDRLFIVDENSSNGTFVNGVFVNRQSLAEGDVIAIGHNRIVFGREAPSRERLAAIAAARLQQTARTAAFGAPTEMLVPPSVLPIHPAETKITEVLEAVVEAAQPVAESRGIHLSVEMEMKSDIVFVDANRIYGALAEILSRLLRLRTPPEHEETIQEATLALRTSHDPTRGGVAIELIWIGPPLPLDQLASLAREGAFRQAEYTAIQHGGLLEFTPPDSPDTLAYLRLPRRRRDVPDRTSVVE